MKLVWTFLICLTIAQTSYAGTVPDGVLWLDKKYQHLMPLLKKGAELIANNGECVEVTEGDISTLKKFAPDNPIFMINCKVKDDQHASFYISQKEIEAEQTVQLPDPIDTHKAEEICKRDLPQKLQFPSSLNVEKVEMTEAKANNGRRRVFIDFTAKNGMGAELPHRATCLAMPNGRTEITITKR